MKTPQLEINIPEPGHLMMIARDPGTTEMRLGQPLVGKAGYVFNDCLNEAGIMREKINICNLVDKQPPNNDFKRHRDDDIINGLAVLQRQLDALEPSLIVTMGNEAAFALIRDWPGSDIKHAKGIEERRGYFWESRDGYKVLATVHPSLVARVWKPWRTLLTSDFRKAREFEHTPLDELRPVREVEIVV